MGNKTTDEQFKKTHQVVGANGGQTIDDLNGKIMKEAPGHDGVSSSPSFDPLPLLPRHTDLSSASIALLQNVLAEQTGQQRTHNEQIERDLATKGYTTRQTDEEAAADAELKKKLDKRGNEAQ